MDLDVRIPWSKGQLKRLGKAMVAGVEVPEDCPSYEHVLDYHDDLAAEIAARIELHDWRNFFEGDFNLSARPKTRDTLVDKLKRRPPHLALHEVQDIAGIRIDSAQLCLTHQRLAAREVAQYFGHETEVHDLLATPHSGYRAVHVWVRVPAGRAEVQIRTQAQSAWANTYETLADRVGRGIRYGKPHRIAIVQQMVDDMHQISREIQEVEETLDDLELQFGFPGESLDHLSEEEGQAVMAERQRALEEEAHYIDGLTRVEAMLKNMEVEL